MNRPSGSIKALAAALGVTERRISQLLALGMPEEPAAAIEWKAARESGDDSATALRRERIELVREQKRKIRLENAKASGDLIDVGAVQASATRVYGVVRGELLKLPGDVAPRIEGLAAAQIQALLRDEIVAILERLSGESGRLHLPD